MKMVLMPTIQFINRNIKNFQKSMTLMLLERDGMSSKMSSRRQLSRLLTIIWRRSQSCRRPSHGSLMMSSRMCRTKWPR